MLIELALIKLTKPQMEPNLDSILQRLDELYAAQDQVGFKITQRVDGRLLLRESVKCLQMKAA